MTVKPGVDCHFVPASFSLLKLFLLLLNFGFGPIIVSLKRLLLIPWQMGLEQMPSQIVSSIQFTQLFTLTFLL